MNTLHRGTPFTLTALACLWLGVVLPAGHAVGQQAESALKDQLLGTWMLVSAYTEREDGSKAETFGPHPIGVVMFDGEGRLALQEMRSDLPKFASNNRQEGTPEENKAMVQGSICYFGTYTLDEAAKTLTFHLEGGSFPNWTGTDQKRSFTLTGDELTWSGVGSSGRPFRTIWKRAK
jgi:lipocalin-like protein